MWAFWVMEFNRRDNLCTLNWYRFKAVYITTKWGYTSFPSQVVLKWPLRGNATEKIYTAQRYIALAFVMSRMDFHPRIDFHVIFGSERALSSMNIINSSLELLLCRWVGMCMYGTWRTPGLSIPWCCLPASSMSALSSSPYHCAFQDGFGLTW